MEILVTNRKRNSTEADTNPVTMAVRLSKGQLIKVLDAILPDDERQKDNK
jgi:hypothetical protein